jgi:catechol 2,3-dioxygenase-like lactoylglutathione lyase family enzyme
VAVGVKLVGLGKETTDNGIVERTGARGKLRSVYCRDPDGNLIESVPTKSMKRVFSSMWLAY